MNREERDVATVPRERLYQRPSPLISAIQGGDITAFQSALQHFHTFDINVGYTATKLAIKLGKIDMLGELLPLVNLQEEDERGRTFLFYAVETEHQSLQITEMLLGRGIEVNHRDWEGTTALRLAAENGNFEVVTRLVGLDEETLLDTVSDCQREYDISNRSVSAVRTLIKCGANVFARTDQEMNVLHIAAKRGCLAIFHALRDYKEPAIQERLVTQSDNLNWTTLHVAAHFGSEDIVNFLLTQYSIDVNKIADRKWTALHFAAKWGSKEIASTLIDYGADIMANTQSGYIPMHLACFAGYDETALLLLDKMINTQQVFSESKATKGYLIWIAARSGCTTVIHRLIQHWGENGSDTLSEMIQGCTAAYCAIENRHFDTANLLVGYEASTEGSDRDQNTALHLAASNGMTRVVEYILGHGNVPESQIESTNAKGETPVQLAARGLHGNIVAALLQHQNPQPIAEVDVTGWTGLHWAARYERIDLVELMVVQGVDTLEEDSCGRRAVDIVERFGGGSIEMVEWLTPAETQDINVSSLPIARPKPATEACKHIRVHMMDIYPRNVIEKSRFSVYSVLYKHGPRYIMAAVSKVQRIKDPLTFRWIHLPANDKIWTEDLTQTIYFDRARARASEPSSRIEINVRRTRGVYVNLGVGGRSPEEEETNYYNKLRGFIKEGLSQEAGSHQFRFIQPFFKHLRTPLDNSYDSEVERSRYNTAHHYEGCRIALSMPFFFFAKASSIQDYEQGRPDNIHMPLILDRFYYHSLPKTDSRNTDQVLFRHLESTDEKRLLCMVDQIWLHVVDNETIITSFSSQKDEGLIDLQKGISNHFIYEKENRPRIESAYEMILLIISLCIKIPIDQELGENGRLLQVFSSAIAKTADEEVKLLERFTSPTSETHQSSNDMRHPGVMPKEIGLLKEIKDILDELNIIRTVILRQRHILDDVFTFLEKQNSSFRRENERNKVNELLDYYWTFSKLEQTNQEVNKLIDEARQTQENINHLLDLRQKDANLSEAIWARKSSEDTKKQAQTIMVFTVVTIIFLPITFLSSLFALDVTSFPHNDSGDLSYTPEWVYSRLFGITVAVSAPLIALAFFVNQVTEFFSDILKKLTRDKTDESNKSHSSNDKQCDPRNQINQDNQGNPASVASPNNRNNGDLGNDNSKWGWGLLKRKPRTPHDEETSIPHDS